MTDRTLPLPAAAAAAAADDDRLVACYDRFWQGDEAAFGEIVRETSDALLLFTHARLHDLSAAEEIVSDALAMIAVRKRSFANDAKLKAYLYTVCHHRAVSVIRQRARRSEQPAEDWTVDPAAETLEARVLRSERDEHLHAVLAALPDEYRTVLYLKFFEGLNRDETAQVLGKSRKQTDNLILRAKQSLRAKLEKEGYPYEEL